MATAAALDAHMPQVIPPLFTHTCATHPPPIMGESFSFVAYDFSRRRATVMALVILLRGRSKLGKCAFESPPQKIRKKMEEKKNKRSDIPKSST